MFVEATLALAAAGIARQATAIRVVAAARFISGKGSNTRYARKDRANSTFRACDAPGMAVGSAARQAWPAFALVTGSLRRCTCPARTSRTSWGWATTARG